MEFAVNVPINPGSFGQVSVALLRELQAKEIEPPLFPMGGSVSLETQKEPAKLMSWIELCLEKAYSHSRKNPCLKLWHLSGSLQSFSEKQSLLTFHETDSLTKEEINAAKNNNIFVTNGYTAEIFKAHGIETSVIPLGFDSYNFQIINRKYFDDDRITFNLCGKFENRKHHKKVIQAWAKKYGNNRKYYLQCALWNSFLKPEENKAQFNSCLEEEYYNVQFMSYFPTNAMYNEFLNSGNIILGMSGGEGWGLPEFQSVALGKHAVILNAHGHKEWANEINSVLVEPSGKVNSHDGKFFNEGATFNQGEIFDWSEDDFIEGCERAINRYELEPINEYGVQLQRDFTYKETTDKLLKEMKKM